MHSQSFKSNFDDLQNTGQSASLDESESYSRVGHARNVCFILNDERRVFLNYAYLVSVELNFIGDNNTLIVCFTSQTVIISGYNLKVLFDKFMHHQPRIIAVTPDRYVLISTAYEFVITEIHLMADNKLNL